MGLPLPSHDREEWSRLYRPDGTFDWAAAEARQRELALEVVRHGDLQGVETVAGVDVSVPFGKAIGRAAIVLEEYPSLQPTAISRAEGELTIPYRPGFLSFRETPFVLEAFDRLGTRPDVLVVDGQGIAHPRRLGIACHIGVLLDLPTIGCAKSVLVGRPTHEVGPEPGDSADLVDRGEVVGRAVRTRRGAKPIYVSIGNKVGLNEAVEFLLTCLRGYRLPEPTRYAHLAAGGKLTL